MKIAILLVIALITITALAAEPIPLPDVRGRIDHMSMDSAGHRLFVAALGNNSVEVIDVARSKVIQSIKDAKEPQGVKYMADLKLLAVASGGDGKCRIYDENLKLQRTIGDLDDADNVRYDEKSKLLYVGY